MKASKSIKSKQIMLSALVALVLVAGYYRWTKDAQDTVPVTGDTLPKIETNGKENAENSETASEEADFFEKSKYDRDLARSEAIAALNQLSEEDISEEEKAKNEEIVSANMEKSQKEAAIENLVIAKGFENCVVFIEDSGISVVVKADSLDSQSANQIKDIVLGQTDFKASQIKISNREK